jgi:hypothetical protein
MTDNNCLVLRVIEYCNYKDIMNIFVIYEPTYDSFFVCGKRGSLEEKAFEPFSFYIEDKHDVSRFIRTIIDESKPIYELCNYNDLPSTCDSIHYSQLRMGVSENKILNSITAEYGKKDKHIISSLLSIIKSVF